MIQMVMALNTAIKSPYQFTKCNTRVFSLEEALYHTYLNWTYTDFISDKFINWVAEDLGLKELSKKLMMLKEISDFSERLFQFLGIIPFFEPTHLDSLKIEVLRWSEDNKHRILKQQGDAIILSSSEKAITYYEEASSSTESADIYNNMGIAFTHNGLYEKAISSFKKALTLEPDNLDILLNYIYVLITYGKLETALELLNNLKNINDMSYVHFLYSKLYESQKDIPKAIVSLEKAIKISSNKKRYFYALSHLYSSSRRYTDAIEILKQIKDRDSIFYKQLAAAYASVSDYPKAIESLEKSIALGENDSNTLSTLANYHRHNYNLDKAISTIEKALAMENNELAMIEEAKIRKAQGKLRDYQKIMDNVLIKAKEDWRKYETK